MLYLEDYLEMIEHLPQELRDRFTEMREMDLSVQNIMDTLEKRSKVFFSQCRRNEIQASAADNEFENLKKDYYKVLEDADEKVSLASSMHELVERYLRRLDSELFKFKCELEADNNGITEVLEKRSLELDGNNSIQNLLNQKENRYFGSIGSSGMSQSQKDKLFRQKPEKRRDSTSLATIVEKRPNISSNILATQSTSTSVQPIRSVTPNISLHGTVLSTSPATPAVSYNVQHVNQTNNQVLNGNVAIISAQASCISTSQQLQQNRRAIGHSSSVSSGNHDLLLNRDLNNSAHIITNIDREQALLHSQRRHKKKLSSNIPHPSTPSQSISSTTMQSVSHSSSLNSVIADPNSSRLNENGMIVEQTADGEWTYDPNEPRYCICNQVSYGDMVACDNEACPFEWFHYPCVGITQSPKGKWYCPKCTLSMRRRNRKN